MELTINPIGEFIYLFLKRCIINFRNSIYKLKKNYTSFSIGTLIIWPGVKLEFFKLLICLI